MDGLQEKRTQVVNFLMDLTEEEAKYKPDETKWSVLEIAEHLYLMEIVVHKQIHYAIDNLEAVEVSEKPINQTTDRSNKVEAPEALQPQGRFHSTEEALSALKESREGTLSILKQYDKQLLASRAIPHPAFGNMSGLQWIEFIGWHELRHLEQMKEITA
ncbi:DinB family protein [Pontibacillus litoralis]|uniref:DinB-like domain-containing protein n=1 Tax=Pontibacillus litoralis JSM 072002 TaxID=1385512 RepID=A0A0A5G7B7_9BACI|nr:DinB family protein [Pontibacillus litoralis]KGX87053.1 hypothetical protein N784_02760 [Pontibacillus litoralis JSM 072002]